jgi:hypothetical protein
MDGDFSGFHFCRLLSLLVLSDRSAFAIGRPTQGGFDAFMQCNDASILRCTVSNWFAASEIIHFVNLFPSKGGFNSD